MTWWWSQDKWGAMGLSRKSTLMYKDLKFAVRHVRIRVYSFVVH